MQDGSAIGARGWWERSEILLAAALGIMAAVALVVLKLASEVLEGDTTTLDRTILVQMRSATEGSGPFQDGLRAAMLDFTALGDTTTLVTIVLIAVGALLSVGRPRLALLLVTQTLAGAGLVSLLKMIVNRDRPDVVAHLASFHSASFPSGHAADSAMVYLSLAILLVPILPSRRARLYALGVAGTLTVLVGLSRLYLGVHWPSDVLAGWMIGAAWAIVVALIAQWFRSRRQLR